MVLLNVVLLEGRSERQKAEGIALLTAAISDALQVDPAHVCIAIDDVPRAHFSSGRRIARPV